MSTDATARGITDHRLVHHVELASQRLIAGGVTPERAQALAVDLALEMARRKFFRDRGCTFADEEVAHAE